MNAQLKLIPDPAEIGTVTRDGYFVSRETTRLMGDGDEKAGRAHLRMLIAEQREQKRHERPTAKPATVQLATQDDEKEVLDLLEADCRAEAPSWAPISRERIAESVTRGTRQNLGVVGIIRVYGKIVACIVIVPNQSAASNAWYLQDVFTVVHPAHRKSSHADDLVKFGCWCSDRWTSDFGYPVHIVFTLNALRKMRKKIWFFRRRAQQIGATFVYPSVTG